MTDRTKNIAIGFFVSGAIAIMIGLILFLKPTIGDGKKILQVRFTNIAGISVGTRVTFAGKPVGEVVKVKELKNARSEIDSKGRIFMYQLTLKVDSSAELYRGDEVTIQTSGLMGQKSIAILPKTPLIGKGTKKITDEVLYASSVDPLERTFQQINKVATEMESAIHRFDTWFAENAPDLANSIRSFDSAMGQAGNVLSSIDQEKLIPLLQKCTSSFNDNLDLVKESLEHDRILQKFTSLIESLNLSADILSEKGAPILSNIHQISKDVASGSGTVGKLLVGNDFYLQLTSLLSKGETLMNDINHYGLLFQYNKQWQKMRTKRANILSALETPQEFKSYFETEIDAMTTSLGRISSLLQRAGGEKGDAISESEAFRNGFAILLRQVQALNDSLKLYNEQLSAQKASF